MQAESRRDNNPKRKRMCSPRASGYYFPINVGIRRIHCSVHEIHVNPFQERLYEKSETSSVPMLGRGHCLGHELFPRCPPRNPNRSPLWLWPATTTSSATSTSSADWLTVRSWAWPSMVSWLLRRRARVWPASTRRGPGRDRRGRRRRRHRQLCVHAHHQFQGRLGAAGIVQQSGSRGRYRTSLTSTDGAKTTYVKRHGAWACFSDKAESFAHMASEPLTACSDWIRTTSFPDGSTWPTCPKACARNSSAESARDWPTRPAARRTTRATNSSPSGRRSSS